MKIACNFDNTNGILSSVARSEVKTEPKVKFRQSS